MLLFGIKVKNHIYSNLNSHTTELYFRRMHIPYSFLVYDSDDATLDVVSQPDIENFFKTKGVLVKKTAIPNGTGNIHTYSHPLVYGTVSITYKNNQYFGIKFSSMSAMFIHLNKVNGIVRIMNGLYCCTKNQEGIELALSKKYERKHLYIQGVGGVALKVATRAYPITRDRYGLHISGCPYVWDDKHRLCKILRDVKEVREIFSDFIDTDMKKQLLMSV